MQIRETVTARGSGRWGPASYDVELTTRQTTWWSSGEDRSQTITTWHLVCEPPAGGRAFATAQERDAFVRVSFGDDLALAPPVAPQVRLPAHPLAELVSSGELSSVTFVRDYLQLRFDGPPLNLYVMPSIHAEGGVLVCGDRGYCDAVAGQVGCALAGVDELLDRGLVLDWDNGVRFGVALDGSGLQGAEAAEFTGAGGVAIWTPGDPPVRWSAPPRPARRADDALGRLQAWYEQHCDGEWEHDYGIAIETLDNPGWRVRIELHHTPLVQRGFERVTHERGADDWLECWVQEQRFNAACGPLNLAEALETFLRWAGA